MPIQAFIERASVALRYPEDAPRVALAALTELAGRLGAETQAHIDYAAEAAAQKNRADRAAGAEILVADFEAVLTRYWAGDDDALLETRELLALTKGRS